MNIDPQVDIDIINELLVNEHRKVSNPFKLNRLRNAIGAFKEDDYLQGIALEASYCVYLNQPRKGYELVKDAIEKHGNHFVLANSLFTCANVLGDWQLVKDALENILTLDMSDINKHEFLDIYNHQSIMNLDDSGKFYNILANFYAIEEQQKIKDNFISKANMLVEHDVSIMTFRKILKVAIAQIYAIYSLNFNVLLSDQENLQLVFSSNYWSTEDTIHLTSLINDAILAVDDDDFQVEADEVEVFCINFSVDKLPENFSIYNDTDDDLAYLVESRMKDTPKPNLEVLDV